MSSGVQSVPPNSHCKNLWHDAQVYLSTFARMCVCIAEVFAATRHIWLSYPTQPPSSPAPQVPQQYQALMVMQAALQLECMQAHTHTLLRHSTLNTLCILSILYSTLDEEYQQQQQQAANWPQGSLVRWFRHTIKKMMQDPATFEYSYRYM